ncbi:MAG: hypothetical protein ACR2NU_06120 [Aeoliella sp.]
MHDSRLRPLVILGICCLLLPGCGSSPSRVGPPSLSPSRAGSAAMKEYDENGDGVVSGAELDKAPGLNAALGNLDTDGDGGVSAKEVSARVRSWIDSKIGVTNARCRISLNGKPLSGGQITFEPEAFLGDAVKVATDKIDSDGTASPSVAKEDRVHPMVPGLSVGLYKVRISRVVNGKETIPAKYNTETLLGQEVAADDPGMQAQWLDIELTTK